MFPGLNPRKMQQMMKQLGIQQVDIPATEVIIRGAVIKGEEKDLVIRNPSVAKVNMMGQETFQITGEVEEREREEERGAAKEEISEEDISEEDIKTVMEQAGVDRKTAERALEESQGDLAEAILKVQKSKT